VVILEEGFGFSYIPVAVPEQISFLSPVMVVGGLRKLAFESDVLTLPCSGLGVAHAENLCVETLVT